MYILAMSRPIYSPVNETEDNNVVMHWSSVLIICMYEYNSHINIILKQSVRQINCYYKLINYIIIIINTG